MSVQASLRWWWVGLAVSVAILAGLWIGEATVDLPRVDDFQQLIPGTIIPAVWMAAGLIAWRARPDSKTGALLVLIGCGYPLNPLSYLVGDHAQWVFLAFGSYNDVLLFWAVLTFPGVPLSRAGRVAVG